MCVLCQWSLSFIFNDIDVFTRKRSHCYSLCSFFSCPLVSEQVWALKNSHSVHFLAFGLEIWGWGGESTTERFQMVALGKDSYTQAMIKFRYSKTRKNKSAGPSTWAAYGSLTLLHRPGLWWTENFTVDANVIHSEGRRATRTVWGPWKVLRPELPESARRGRRKGMGREREVAQHC